MPLKRNCNIGTHLASTFQCIIQRIGASLNLLVSLCRKRDAVIIRSSRSSTHRNVARQNSAFKLYSFVVRLPNSPDRFVRSVVINQFCLTNSVPLRSFGPSILKRCFSVTWPVFVAYNTYELTQANGHDTSSSRLL